MLGVTLRSSFTPLRTGTELNPWFISLLKVESLAEEVNWVLRTINLNAKIRAWTSWSRAFIRQGPPVRARIREGNGLVFVETRVVVQGDHEKRDWEQLLVDSHSLAWSWRCFLTKESKRFLNHLRMICIKNLVHPETDTTCADLSLLPPNQGILSSPEWINQGLVFSKVLMNSSAGFALIPVPRCFSKISFDPEAAK